MKLRPHAPAIVGFLMAIAAPSFAFENVEHKAIGDMSIALARLAQNCGADPERCKLLDTLVDGARSARSVPVPSYGDIVQCVDQHLTPEKLIAQLRADARVGENSMGAAPRRGSAFPGPEDLKDNRACKFSNAILDMKSTQASHNNHSHFQDELLVSIVTYHALALTIARDQKNLGGALIVNAIASHYLQDLFAPGHIVSRRDALTDTVSLAMHDFHNEKGARFRVAAMDEGTGNATRDALLTMACVLGGDAKTYCVSGRIAQAQGNGEMAKRLADSVLCQLVHRPDVDGHGCTRPLPLQNADRNEMLNKVRLAIDAILGINGSERKDWICMKGDKRFWRDPKGKCDDAIHQRAFVVAVNLASILDVLAAQSRGNYANNFREIAWEYDAPFDLNGKDLAYASLPFGEFSMGPRGPSQASANGGSPLNSPGTAPSSVRNSAPPQPKNVDDGDPGRSNFIFENLYRATVGRESFYKGDRAGRNVYALETQPLWRELNNPRKEPFDFGLGLGLVAVREKDVQAGGGMLRAMTTFPKLESTISVWTRRMHHTGNAERGWRNGYGIAYEQGFSSMFSVYVGMGRDYGAVSGGSLNQGTMFFAGIAVTGPQSRIVGFLGDTLHPEKD